MNTRALLVLCLAASAALSGCATQRDLPAYGESAADDRSGEAPTTIEGELRADANPVAANSCSHGLGAVKGAGKGAVTCLAPLGAGAHFGPFGIIIGGVVSFYCMPFGIAIGAFGGLITACSPETTTAVDRSVSTANNSWRNSPVTP